MFYSVYWRTVLAIVLLILTMSFVHQQFNVLNLIENNNYHPTFYWGLVATTLAAITLFERKGLVYMLGGWWLNASPELWQKHNVATITFFVALAVLAMVVYVFFDKEIWGYYKLFGQLFLLLVVPGVVARYILKMASPAGVEPATKA